MVSNGGFEGDAVTTPTFQYMCPTSWTCFACTTSMCGGAVLVMRSDTAWGGGGAPSGSYYLGIQGSTSYINQQLQLNRELTLMLQFTARNRPGYGTATLTISLGDTSVWSGIPPTSWSTYQAPISATANSALLQFTTIYSSGNSEVTIQVDDIMLCSTLYLLGGVCNGM